MRLTDEFYMLQAAQLALICVSQDPTEEQQLLFLRDMPEKWLFLPFHDDLRRGDLGKAKGGLPGEGIFVDGKLSVYWPSTRSWCRRLGRGKSIPLSAQPTKQDMTTHDGI